MLRRSPAVAGYFYPAERDELLKLIEKCFNHDHGPKRLPPASENGSLIALVSPHAGYIYSGPVAAHGYLRASASQNVDVYVVVGPNHYGIGNPLAVYPSGAWQTALGDIKISDEFTNRLMKELKLFYPDPYAHSREHSIEVQLPFIQFIRKGDFSFVPICMGLQDMETAVQVGRAIAKTAMSWEGRVLIIASTDFTHYEPHEIAKARDTEQIRYVLNMDVKGHYENLEMRDVSMCGYGPTAAVMEAARLLGARKSILLKYATSGDTSGNKESVVGYASIAFYAESSSSNPPSRKEGASGEGQLKGKG